MKHVLSFAQNDSGATAIEYGLIASLIAVVIVTAAGQLGGRLSGTLSNIKNHLS